MKSKMNVAILVAVLVVAGAGATMFIFPMIKPLGKL